MGRFALQVLYSFVFLYFYKDVLLLKYFEKSGNYLLQFMCDQRLAISLELTQG